MPGNKVRPVAERFWEKVKKCPNCWEWQAGKIPKGYGVFNVGPPWRHIYAHRMSYELRFGTFPKRLLVLHRCDNPGCVRPGHLFLGTAADNSADMVGKGRAMFGEKSSAAKLTAKQVQEIKKAFAAGARNMDLAKKYKIGKPQISRIVYGERWAHLEN